MEGKEKGRGLSIKPGSLTPPKDHARQLNCLFLSSSHVQKLNHELIHSSVQTKALKRKYVMATGVPSTQRVGARLGSRSLKGYCTDRLPSAIHYLVPCTLHPKQPTKAHPFIYNTHSIRVTDRTWRPQDQPRQLRLTPKTRRSFAFIMKCCMRQRFWM